jgi:hypothetical protein
MTPTNKLRFVERDSYSKNGEHFVEPFKVRILQQWFDGGGGFEHVQTFDEEGHLVRSGEWRDVPLEKE